MDARTHRFLTGITALLSLIAGFQFASLLGLEEPPLRVIYGLFAGAALLLVTYIFQAERGP